MAEWRFWNKAERRMEYGLGHRPDQYEDRNFIAMKRILTFEQAGLEVFESDIVAIDSAPSRFRVEVDGRLVTASGEFAGNAAELRREHLSIVGQDPLGEWHLTRPDVEIAKAS